MTIVICVPLNSPGLGETLGSPARSSPQYHSPVSWTRYTQLGNLSLRTVLSQQPLKKGRHPSLAIRLAFSHRSPRRRVVPLPQPLSSIMSHIEKAQSELTANPPPAAYSGGQTQYYRKLGNPGPLCVYRAAHLLIPTDLAVLAQWTIRLCVHHLHPVAIQCSGPRDHSPERRDRHGPLRWGPCAIRRGHVGICDPEHIWRHRYVPVLSHLSITAGTRPCARVRRRRRASHELSPAVVPNAELDPVQRSPCTAVSGCRSPRSSSLDQASSRHTRARTNSTLRSVSTSGHGSSLLSCSCTYQSHHLLVSARALIMLAP